MIHDLQKQARKAGARQNRQNNIKLYRLNLANVDHELAKRIDLIAEEAQGIINFS